MPNNKPFINIKEYSADYIDFIKDESNITGDDVSEIVFPENAQELSDYFCANVAKYFYISGSRTGVVGGAVPKRVKDGDVSLVSLSNIKDIGQPYCLNEEIYIDVGSGVSLFELETYLRESYPNYFFPVDPTEKWASFGGMASTNASGARSFYYSSVRSWIEQLEVVLVDGKILELKRGREKLHGGLFCFNEKQYEVPVIPKPTTKNSLGYFSNLNSDLIDLFIGSEGTLGVITKLTLKLKLKTNNVLSILQFFKDAKSALAFVSIVRHELVRNCLALEFLDNNSFKIALESPASLSEQVEKANNLGLCFGVFAEFKYLDEDEISSLYERLSAIIESLGADFANSICGMEDSEIEIIKRFRHAIPEGINKKIALRKKDILGLRKIATDMAVPSSCLEEVYDLYSNTLLSEGLEHYIFGHAGDNHFHVNIVPRNKNEMERALEIYEMFAGAIVKMGGSVSAEHGIGRIKKRFLLIQYPPNVISDMRKIKTIFDPKGRLSHGVLFD